MNVRRALLWVALVAIAFGVVWFLLRPTAVAPAVPSSTPPAAKSPPAAPPPAAPDEPADDPATGGASHLADDLNAPGGTIQRDLEIINELFGTWQTNFPREGNPVGENAEITAALAGENVLKFAFIIRPHRAINAQGELCDRWGTPFRFHQLSGRQMEIRSAGPDRRFGNDDDAIWQPPQ